MQDPIAICLQTGLAQGGEKALFAKTCIGICQLTVNQGNPRAPDR